MIRGFAAMRGATSAISRSSAAIAADVHLSSTSIAFSHSITTVTAGTSVFLAIARSNIGSPPRQARPLLYRVGMALAVSLEVVGTIPDISRERNGALCPYREGDEMAEWNDPRTTGVNTAATVGV